MFCFIILSNVGNKWKIITHCLSYNNHICSTVWSHVNFLWKVFFCMQKSPNKFYRHALSNVAVLYIHKERKYVSLKIIYISWPYQFLIIETPQNIKKTLYWQLIQEKKNWPLKNIHQSVNNHSEHVESNMDISGNIPPIIANSNWNFIHINY